ncbi:MAG: Rieske (2Fe-2S) protein [Myxococcota bacterium]|nr:Rieske (2Fe-2S) protein [Myxococcota bacterium]
MQERQLVRVGVYERTVRASLERVWENVLDWEHLPWLHAGSFRAIDCEDAGDWGWRAWIGLASGARIRLELVIEHESLRYVSRTLEGSGAGTEIWTQLRAEGSGSTAIEVSFHLPDVKPGRQEALGVAYTTLYTRLWDEDEEMMRVRSAELARAKALAPPVRERVRVGRADELPTCVEQGGRRWRVLRVGDRLLAHAAVCPHRLGPLGAAAVEDGCVRCPWHGYRFDLASGRSADGRGLRLPPAPAVEVDADGSLWLADPRGQAPS